MKSDDIQLKQADRSATRYYAITRSFKDVDAILDVKIAKLFEMIASTSEDQTERRADLQQKVDRLIERQRRIGQYAANNTRQFEQWDRMSDLEQSLRSAFTAPLAMLNKKWAANPYKRLAYSQEVTDAVETLESATKQERDQARNRQQSNDGHVQSSSQQQPASQSHSQPAVTHSPKMTALSVETGDQSSEPSTIETQNEAAAIQRDRLTALQDIRSNVITIAKVVTNHRSGDQSDTVGMISNALLSVGSIFSKGMITIAATIAKFIQLGISGILSAITKAADIIKSVIAGKQATSVLSQLPIDGSRGRRRSKRGRQINRTETTTRRQPVLTTKDAPNPKSIDKPVVNKPLSTTPTSDKSRPIDAKKPALVQPKLATVDPKATQPALSTVQSKPIDSLAKSAIKGGIAKGAARAVPVAGAALALYDVNDRYQAYIDQYKQSLIDQSIDPDSDKGKALINQYKNEAASRVAIQSGSEFVGGLVGSVLGTAAMPGVGTVGGGIAGSIAGEKVGDWLTTTPLMTAVVGAVSTINSAIDAINSKMTGHQYESQATKPPVETPDELNQDYQDQDTINPDEAVNIAVIKKQSLTPAESTNRRRLIRAEISDQGTSLLYTASRQSADPFDRLAKTLVNTNNTTVVNNSSVNTSPSPISTSINYRNWATVAGTGFVIGG